MGNSEGGKFIANFGSLIGILTNSQVTLEIISEFISDNYLNEIRGN